MKNRSVWIKILKELHDEKKKIILLLVCLLVSSAIVFVQPLIIRNITDKGMMGKNFKIIVQYAVLCMIILISAQILEVIKTKLFTDISNSVSYRIYQRVLKKIVTLPIGYFQDKSSTEIVGALNKDIDMIGLLLNQYTAFSITGVLQMVGGIGGLFILEPHLAAIVSVVIPIKILISEVIARKKNILMKNLIICQNTFEGWLGEQIEGIEEVKLWNLYDKLSSMLGVKRKVIMKLLKTSAVLDQQRTFYDTLVDIVINTVLYIISGYLIVKGKFTVGSAFAFITYSGYVTIPVSAVVSMRYNLAQIKPSVERLISFFDLEEEKNLVIQAEKKFEDTKIIEFQHVKFSYGEDKLCLSDISFSIEKGDKVAIIGNNGVGKSTIFNLILGFYQPQSGNICILGKCISEWSVEKLRENISIVRQDPFLFSTSIWDNIVLSNHYTVKEINRAVALGGADSFIYNLPYKYDQKVGKNGTKLSGGEKEKIAVSRALLKKCDIFLFDEAFAGYDQKSKAEFFVHMKRELKDKTFIYITHQENELKNADYILELKDGQILKRLSVNGE